MSQLYSSSKSKLFQSPRLPEPASSCEGVPQRNGNQISVVTCSSPVDTDQDFEDCLCIKE
jgi:hypothetical protein